MAARNPEQIQRWLEEHLHRLDLPQQWLGDEPNAVRKPWDSAAVRWLMVASWVYEAAAGNSSIPAVYKAVNDARDDFLCDRTYLPATPRDLGLLEKAGIGQFGIESKHQMRDFDVVGTSISYPVLSMSFVKQLKMSDIPIRWRDRDPGRHPMVIAGGQSFGAPEMLAPVVDCWWLGEVEDEDDNPGVGAVTGRIAGFKASGAWQADRIGCYETLAREFNFLYFPRFVAVHYAYEDRTPTGVGPLPSKQVIGFTSTLDGMRLPFRKRHVKNLDNAAPLDNPPLLYADPAMGSGDLEVARSCPAWCSFPLLGSTEIVTLGGVIPIESAVDRFVRVWTRVGWKRATVERHGMHETQEIIFAAAGKDVPLQDACDYGHVGQWLPADPRRRCTECRRIRTRNAYYVRTGRAELVEQRTRVESDSGTARGWRHFGKSKWRRSVTATPCHGWTLVDGTTTHALKVGDYVPANCVQPDESSDPFRRGWLHGFLFGDGHQRRVSEEYEGGSFTVRLHGAKDAVHRTRFEQILVTGNWRGRLDRTDHDIRVTSITAPPSAAGEYVVHGWAPFSVKRLPETGDPDYLAGFLDGWCAADKAVRPNGIWVLNSQNPDAAPWLERNSAIAGRVLHGQSVDPSTETNFGSRNDPLMKFTLAPAQDRGWRVMEIRPIAGQQMVYCLTVPGVHEFTLASGISTMNCALSWRTKPYRQRTVGNVLDYAKRFQDNMGSVRMAPFSPDFPMYTQKKKLVSELLENVSDEVDAPTMRVDDFIADNDFMLLQVHGGMDSVTLGVEGSSQRMRDLVGKGTSDKDIKDAVTRGIRAGIRKFKLYMISNLPGEDEGDAMRVLQLAKDLADIRESMHQPTVRIQFSWTPLLIEANTPFQWFAPQLSSRVLGDIWEEFRDLKIDPKLGAKGEPNKFAFFQLCQRASRDVGEALVDAMEIIDQATYGGVPRNFKELLEQQLYKHGFNNGYADCFDERFRYDMFGWEFIDQGVSSEIMWTTYLQMREFVEYTDSRTYDQLFSAGYHGSEWVERCDTRCMGKRCGACTPGELKIRAGYIRAGQTDHTFDLAALVPIDQRSQAFRVRARLTKTARHRFVDNSHWRFAVRRAAFLAQTTLGLDHGIAKRSIRFASDGVKHRDWTAGVDYVEFGMTRPMHQQDIQTFLDHMDRELEPWLRIDEWTTHSANATTMRADVDLSLFDLEVDDPPATIVRRVTEWQQAQHIPMRLKIEGGYFAPTSEEVNAKDYVEQLWLVRAGHQLHLRMLIRGRPSPYNIYAALTRRASWLDAARHPATRLEAFVTADRSQQDFLRPNCQQCGLQIPTTVLDRPYHPQHCPACKDRHDKIIVDALDDV